MLTVHHLNNSRSHRVLWLLEELELKYEVAHYQRDPQTLRAPAALRQIHPLGKSPVVTDGDVVLSESGAIIESLLEKYGGGRLAPAPGSVERVRYLHFLHYAEGSAMPYLLLKLITDRLPKPPMPLLLRPFAAMIGQGLSSKFVNPELERHTAYLVQHLERHPWFAGSEFSAADIQMSFVIQALVTRGTSGGPNSPFTSFLARIETRPAYQRALARGGPFQISV